MNFLEHRLQRRRRQCRDRRRYVAELEVLARRLRADESRLQDEITRAVALAPPAGGRSSTAAAALIERHRKLAGSVAAVDLQLAEAGAALSVAEHDLRRHEVAWAARAPETAVAPAHRSRRRGHRFP